MTANVTRGWAPLRACSSGAKNTSTCRSPSSTSSTWIGRDDQPRHRAHRRNRGAGQHPQGLRHDAARPAARRDARDARAPAIAGYIGGGAVIARGRYTDEDDPKRLVELENNDLPRLGGVSAGRSGDAIALYKNVIAKRNDNEDAYRELALVYWREGRPDAAIARPRVGAQERRDEERGADHARPDLAESGQLEKAIALLESDFRRLSRRIPRPRRRVRDGRPSRGRHTYLRAPDRGRSDRMGSPTRNSASSSCRWGTMPPPR